VHGGWKAQFLLHIGECVVSGIDPHAIKPSRVVTLLEKVLIITCISSIEVTESRNSVLTNKLYRIRVEQSKVILQ